MILNSQSHLSLLQFFIQIIILTTYWQYSLSNFAIYLLGFASLTTTLISFLFSTTNKNDNSAQSSKNLSKLMSAISIISQLVQISFILQENANIQLNFLSIGLLTILIANMTIILLSYLKSESIQLVHIISNSFLIICSLISFVFLHTYSIQNSELSSLNSEILTNLKIFSGIAAFCGIIGLILFNYFQGNARNVLAKIYNIFQILLLISMIWSISFSQNKFSDAQTNFTDNCQTNLKSIHQKSLSNFGCDSKYERNWISGIESYSTQCPTSQMTVMWEQDQGKINSQKQNQIVCLNLDCCAKITETMGSSFFKTEIAMIFSVLLMAIALVSSFYLKKQNYFKNLVKTLLSVLVIATVIGAVYLTSFENDSNLEQMIKTPIKFKSAQISPLTPLSQRMLFQTHKSNSTKRQTITADATVCVKDDITLSDYTADEGNIQICDDKAQAITLHTKYKDLQKTQDKCSANLQTCQTEKSDLKSLNDKCEAGRKGDKKEAEANANEQYNNNLIVKIDEAKSEANKECDQKTQKLNDKILKKQEEISKLQIDVKDAKDSCHQDNDKKLQDLKSEYETLLKEKDEQLLKESNNYQSFNVNFASLEKLVQNQSKIIKELSQNNDTCEEDKLAFQTAKEKCEATKEAEIEKAKATVSEEWSNKLLIKVEEAKDEANQECTAKTNELKVQITEKETKINNLQTNIENTKSSGDKKNDKEIKDLKAEYEKKLKEKENNYKELNNNFIILQDLVKTQTLTIEKQAKQAEEKSKTKEKNLEKQCDNDKQKLQDKINQLTIELQVANEQVKLYEDYQNSVKDIEKLIQTQTKTIVQTEKENTVAPVDNSKDFKELTIQLNNIQKTINNQKDKTIKEKEDKITILQSKVQEIQTKADKCESSYQVFQEQQEKQEAQRMEEKIAKEKEEKKQKKEEQKVVQPQIIQQNCDAYISEIDGLKDQLESQETTITQLTSFQKDFKDYQTTLKQIIVEQTNEVIEVAKEPKEEKKEKKPEESKNDKKLLEGVNSLKTQLDQIEQKIKQEKDEIINKQDKKIMELETQITKLSEIKQEPSIKETIIDKESIKELEKVYEKLNTQKDKTIKEKDQKISSLEVKVSDLKEKADKCESQIVFLKEQSVKDQEKQTNTNQQDQTLLEIENQIAKLSEMKQEPSIKETILDKDSIKELEKVYKQLNTEKDKTIKEKDEKISSLEVKVSDFKEKADKCESQIVFLKEQSVKDQEKQTNTNQQDQTLLEIENQIAKLSEMKQEPSIKETILDKDSIKELEKVYKQLNTQKDKTIKEKDEKISSLEVKVSDFKEKADKCESKVVVLEDQYEKKEREFKEAQEKEEKQKQKDVQPQIIEQNCDAYISEIDVLKDQLESQETTITQLTSFQQSFTDYQTTLKDIIVKQSKEASDKSKETTTSEKNYTQPEAQIVTIDNSEDFAKLEEKLNKIQQSIKTQKDTTIKEKDEQISLLQVQVSDFKQKADKCESKVVVLEDQQVKYEKKEREIKEAQEKENEQQTVVQPQIIEQNCDAYISEIDILKDQLESQETTMTQLTSFQKEFKDYQTTLKQIIVERTKPEVPKEEKKEKKPEEPSKNDIKVLEGVTSLITKLNTIENTIKKENEKIINQQNSKITELQTQITKLSEIKQEPIVQEKIIEKDNSEELSQVYKKLDKCRLQNEPIIQTCDYTIYKQQIDTLNTQIQQYEATMKNQNEEKENDDKIIVEISNLKNQIDGLKSTIQTEQGNMKSKDAEIQTLQDTIIVLQETCKQKESSEKDKKEAEQKTTAKQLEKQTKYCQEFSKEIDELKTQIGIQTQQLKQQKEETPAQTKLNSNTVKLIDNVDKLSIKLDNIKNDIQQQKDKNIKSNEETIQTLQQTITSFKEKVATCQATVQANEKLQAEQKKELEKEKTKEKECDFSSYTQQITTLKSQIISYEATIGQIKELKQQIEAEDSNNYDGEILDKIVALKSSLSDLSKSVKEKDTQITTLNTQITSLQSENKACENKITVQKENSKTESNKLSELQGKIEVLQSDKKELQNQITTVQNNLVQIQEQSSQYEAAASQCETEKAEIKTSDQCEAEKQQCEVEKAKEISKNEQCNKQIKDIKTERDQYLTNYQKELTECAQQKNALKEEQAKTKDSSKNECDTKIQKQIDKLDVQKQKVTELQTKNDELESDQKVLTSQLDTCVKDKEEFQTKIATLSANVDSLTVQVKEKKDSLSKLSESKESYFTTVNSANDKLEVYLNKLTDITAKFEKCNTEKVLLVTANKTCQTQKAELEADNEQYLANYESDKEYLNEQLSKCEIDKAVAEQHASQGCPPCKCMCEEKLCPVCPDCITESSVFLQKSFNGKCPSGYNLEYKVEKVVSPDICIWPDTEFKKQLRKLGVIQDKLVKKTNSVFQIIDFQTQKALNNAYIEVYSGKIACQDVQKVPLNTQLTNFAGETVFQDLPQNNYYTAQIKKEGYQVSCQSFYIGGNKDSMYSIALIPQISYGYSISLEWNNPQLDLQLLGTFSYSDQDTCLVGFLNNQCGEMIFNTPVRTDNYAAQLITINQVALSNYLFFTQNLHQSADQKQFISANPRIKIYNSESVYPIAELVPPMMTEDQKNKQSLIWLATCLDETSSQAELKQIGQFWNTQENTSELDDGFINLPTTDVCSKNGYYN